MSCVRPGVFDVRARALCPVNALSALDLPAFERPAKATSAPWSKGNWVISWAASTKCALFRGFEDMGAAVGRAEIASRAVYAIPRPAARWRGLTALSRAPHNLLIAARGGACATGSTPFGETYEVQARRRCHDRDARPWCCLGA